MNTLIIPPPGHPLNAACNLALAEIESGRTAIENGNDGRARVCGRRAVGAVVLALGRPEYGTHALANLRGIAADTDLPPDVRQAAERLLGGARSIIAGQAYSTTPLADAIAIINHLIALHR